MSTWSRIEKGFQKAVTKLNSQYGIATIDSTATPNRYGEIKNKETKYNPPIYFYGIGTNTPLQAQVEDSGWHSGLESIQIESPIVEFQRVGLADANGKPLFSVGDRIIANGDQYEIRTINTTQPAVSGMPISIIVQGYKGVM